MRWKAMHHVTAFWLLLLTACKSGVEPMWCFIVGKLTSVLVNCGLHLLTSIRPKTVCNFAARNQTVKQTETICSCSMSYFCWSNLLTRKQHKILDCLACLLRWECILASCATSFARDLEETSKQAVFLFSARISPFIMIISIERYSNTGVNWCMVKVIHYKVVFSLVHVDIPLQSTIPQQVRWVLPLQLISTFSWVSVQHGQKTYWVHTVALKSVDWFPASHLRFVLFLANKGLVSLSFDMQYLSTELLWFVNYEQVWV